jgi:hypothetical protein
VNTPCAGDRIRPGELLRLVTDGLASSGLDVRPPGHKDSRCLAIAVPGAQCTLEVTDYGSVKWEYSPWPPDEADPDLTADLATILLTGRPGPFPRLGGGHRHQNITFKGIVGLELKARGLDVELAVYADEDHFDAFAEIIATAPGSGDDEAQACITDDGCLTWIREHWPGADIVSGPDLCGWIANPATVAATVAQTVTRAMACLPPAARDGPREQHGRSELRPAHGDPSSG